MNTLRLAAGSGAALLLVTSSGHPVVVAVLLGVVAASPLAGVAAGLAGLGMAMRWGTTSLASVAGAQAVLGPALAVGPEAAAVGSALGALALLAAAPAGLAAVPFGLAAALLAAGPAATSLEDAAIRAAAGLVAVGLAMLSGRFVPRRPALVAAVVLGGLAIAAQVAA